MKRGFRDGFAYGLWIGGCAGFAFLGLILRILNPSLTETELFLRYWPVWVMAIVIALIGVVLAWGWRDG